MMDMSITVREALQLKELNECHLIAGSDGLDRQISYIDNMEVPNIIPWLRKDELLVTTAYAVKDDEAAVMEIIRALSDVGAAGIALKTKFLGNITQRIQELADELKIPVIVLPREMGFIELTTPLMKAIVDSQSRKLEFAKEMSEKFLQAQMEGGSFQEICQILGELVSCQVFITNTKWEIQYQYPQGKEKPASLPADWHLEHPEILRQEICIKNMCLGYLYGHRPDEGFDEMDQIAFRQGTSYLAVEFARQMMLEEKAFYQDNNFFQDLLYDNIFSEEEAKSRARELRWPEFPYRMVVSDINDFEGIISGKEEHKIQEIKEEIIAIHKEVLKNKQRFFLAVNISDSFHCLFPKDTGKEELRSYMAELKQQMAQRLQIQVTTGVSREIYKFQDFQKGYRECRKAIQIGRHKLRADGLYFIDELELEEAFLELGNLEFFKNFASAGIKVLEDYDLEHGSHLLETLSVLTEHLGSRKETASALYLHRNSLAYRIGQIEQLTGYDLNDAKTIFHLGMAVKIWEYMEHPDPK